jgi:hypothetical protein
VNEVRNGNICNNFLHLDIEWGESRAVFTVELISRENVSRHSASAFRCAFVMSMRRAEVLRNVLIFFCIMSWISRDLDKFSSVYDSLLYCKVSFKGLTRFVLKQLVKKKLTFMSPPAVAVSLDLETAA